MKYPDKLIVVPLEAQVLLPSVVVRLLIRGKQATELTKDYFQSPPRHATDIYIACIPLKPPQKHSHSKNETAGASSQAPQVPIPSTTQQPTEKYTGLVSIRDRSRLLNYGCLARIIRVQKSGTNLFNVYVEGLARFKVVSYSQNTPSMSFANCWMTHVEYIIDNILEYPAVEIEFKALCQQFVVKLQELQVPETLLNKLEKRVNTLHVSSLADILVSLIETSFDEKFDMLSTPLLQDRLALAVKLLRQQLKEKMDKRQREFYLRQQLDTVPNESSVTTTTYRVPDEQDEFQELCRRLQDAKLPDQVVIVAQRELKRIKKLQQSSSEWAVSRNYLDWLADLPWSTSTPDHLDIQRAKRQLDKDHFGLDHVKKRMIEYLSVIKIKGDLKAPILCFVGPPGVGKTSLGKSIATSLSREFHRISLGGVRDEAEMRGHRRTYVGSMPGLIIQGLRKCKVNNPVLLLDEIDKLVHNSKHGDPAAALLEILDPEQNNSFSDHYLNVPFDLSRVLFIATANSLDTIPEPLLDRMEVIELHGYTFEEKLHIAKTHLVPKQVKVHGLAVEQVEITNEAILYVAENYTMESGVRSLERTLASLVRAKCVQLAEQEEQYSPHIDVSDVRNILGNPKYEKQVAERDSYPGVVTGLAYSRGGNGGILFVEVSKMPGDGKLHLTGSLGKVIQESAKLALSWVKSNAFDLKLTHHPKKKLVQHEDIHIHFPSGSVPKDGPSAGVTLVCAIVSLYSGKRVPTTTAMTGEISLRGQVLPVGGIKEKIISAHRAGIRKVIIPVKNQKDVEADIPASVRDDIEFCYASNMWQVLGAAFDSYQQHKSLEESHM